MAMAPTVGVHAAVLRIDLQRLQAAEHLRGERLVDLDDVHVGQRQPGPGQSLSRRRHGPKPHHPRLYSGDGGRDNARQRHRAGLLTHSVRSDDERGGPRR